MVNDTEAISVNFTSVISESSWGRPVSVSRSCFMVLGAILAKLPSIPRAVNLKINMMLMTSRISFSFSI